MSFQNQHLRAAVNLLISEMKSEDEYFPVYQGDPLQLRWGMGYWVRPAVQGKPSWLKKSPLSKHPTCQGPVKVAFIINWEHQLRAFLNTKEKFAYPQAFMRVLFAYIDLMDHYDPILADALRACETSFRQHPEKHQDLTWYGQTHATDRVLRNHLRYFLWRQSNVKAFRHLVGSINASLERIGTKMNKSSLGKCADKHRRSTCAICKTAFNVQRDSSVIFSSVCNGPNMGATKRLVVPAIPARNEKPLSRECRYLLSALEQDGVYPAGDNLLVEFPAYLRTLYAVCPTSPLLALIGTPEHPTDSQEVVEHLDVLGCVVDDKPALYGAAERLGLEVLSPLTQALLDTAALKARVEGSLFAAKRIVTHKARPARRKTIELSYATPEGFKTIRVIKQQQRNEGYSAPMHFFTTPYSVVPYATTKRRLLQVNGESYWSLDGIAQHTSMYENGALAYPEAIPFHTWASRQHGRLLTQGFNSALYEQSLSKRLIEKNKGLRGHIGRFTAKEDNILRAFFGTRPPGFPSSAEWDDLGLKLPGRSRIGIQRRLEVLGFEYAFAHGYKKYLASGYCMRRDPARRQRWLAKGVKA